MMMTITARKDRWCLDREHITDGECLVCVIRYSLNFMSLLAPNERPWWMLPARTFHSQG